MDIVSLQLEYKQYLELVEVCGGEVNDADIKALEKLQTQLVSKADSCHWVLKRLDTEAKFFKEESKRLAEYGKTFSNAKEALKERIEEALHQVEGGEIEGETVTFKLKQNPPALKIVDENALPKEFRKEVTETVVDKIGIKDALKKGIEIAGAVLTQGKSLLISRPRK